MRSILSIASLLAALALALPAGAQEPAKGAKPAAKLDADAFRLPASAYDTSKLNYDPPTVKSGGGFNPGRVDLGESVLQFDTKRLGPDHRVGIETIDPHRLGGISKEDSSPLPNYFGMTLSKPLN